MGSLIAKGMVDPEKPAVMGWSNGSIITIELTTRMTRYKAARAGVGDVNWISDWGNAVFGRAFDDYYLGKSPLSHSTSQSPCSAWTRCGRRPSSSSAPKTSRFPPNRAGPSGPCSSWARRTCASFCFQARRMDRASWRTRRARWRRARMVRQVPVPDEVGHRPRAQAGVATGGGAEADGRGHGAGDGGARRYPGGPL